MIKLNDISKSFGSLNVLVNISLDIDKQDHIALIGANGAGKTTLIRCLLGEYIYDGDVLIDGFCPRKDRLDALSKVAFVPQLPPPLKMPVMRLIKFNSSLCDVDASEIIDLCSELGLDIDKIKAKPFVKLSGGQKQKILIAIALARPVEVFIMDEPMANLDPKARKSLFDLLATRQCCMVMSSHRLEEVMGLVNRVVELDGGKVTLDYSIRMSSTLSDKFTCSIISQDNDEAFNSALISWGFKNSSGNNWNANILAADRMRFLAFISRYGGIIQSIHMSDEKAAT